MTQSGPMTTVGLIGAGHMGSALGWALREGGHEVITTLAGRSLRTRRLAADAGLITVPDLATVISAAAIILVVTPPGAALAVAAEVADAGQATQATPLVADLNAVSPATVRRISATLANAGLDLVDGAISGPAPTLRPGATIYLSGPRAREVATLRWRHVKPVLVDGDVGRASAVKMCTASVYKGLVGLYAQAMRTAAHHGVLEHVLADLADDGHIPAGSVAVATTKAHRYVAEMREIASTQAGAGLPATLFEGFAEVYADLAGTAWAKHDPESVDRTIGAQELMLQLTRSPSVVDHEASPFP